MGNPLCTILWGLGREGDGHPWSGEGEHRGGGRGRERAQACSGWDELEVKLTSKGGSEELCRGKGGWGKGYRSVRWGRTWRKLNSKVGTWDGCWGWI